MITLVTIQAIIVKPPSATAAAKVVRMRKAKKVAGKSVSELATRITASEMPHVGQNCGSAMPGNMATSRRQPSETDVTTVAQIMSRIESECGASAGLPPRRGRSIRHPKCVRSGHSGICAARLMIGSENTAAASIRGTSLDRKSSEKVAIKPSAQQQ
jgi:hypothetical protein